jgi:transposase InsO family protein
VSPDPKKIEALQNASNPTSGNEVCSLLQMANYLARFIPDFATMIEPLRELTKTGTPWSWEPKHQKALDRLKATLSSDTVMSYFDPTNDTELIVDASPVGLGAVLTQRDTKTGAVHVVSYASKTLTDVQRRYSQTEREALAILWGCERFHLYLYGGKFKVISDHKPLESIWNNPRSKPPARIEKWGLRLQAYDCEIVYKAGKSNAADYMSRHPLESDESDRESKVTEEYVNFLASNSVPKAMTLEEVKVETKADPTMQHVAELIRSRKWLEAYTDTSSDIDLSEIKSLAQVKDELTVTTDSDIILRGSRIVMPKSLRQRAVELSHEGHQGIVKTKQLIREKVWFPGIDNMTAQLIKGCTACQAATPDVKHAEPLRMSELPKGLWVNVSADFYGPLPSGEYLLVIVDEYSRFPVVEIVRSTSGKTVIPMFDKVFSQFGIPEVVKTDNGPPFNGHEFAAFAKHMGFQHRKITPCWPQANGEAERFMKTLGKVIRSASVETNPWKQLLYRFLRNYRATPHSSTNCTPAQLLFNRELHIKLPDSRNVQVNDQDGKARKRDAHQKNKMKCYADEKRHAKTRTIMPGAMVLVRQEKKNKLSTPFSTKPYKVIQVKGSMITVERNGHRITRNSSFFKPTQIPSPMENETPEEIEEYLDEREDMYFNRQHANMENDPPPMVAHRDPPPEAKRYPTRVRSKPSRFKDYV